MIKGLTVGILAIHLFVSSSLVSPKQSHAGYAHYADSESAYVVAKVLLGLAAIVGIGSAYILNKKPASNRTTDMGDVLGGAAQAVVGGVGLGLGAAQGVTGLTVLNGSNGPIFTFPEIKSAEEAESLMGLSSEEFHAYSDRLLELNALTETISSTRNEQLSDGNDASEVDEIVDQMVTAGLRVMNLSGEAHLAIQKVATYIVEQCRSKECTSQAF